MLAWYTVNSGSAHECAKGLQGLPTTYLPRVAQLRKAGLLRWKDGEPRRPTGLGGTAAVIEISEAGRREAMRLGVDPLSRLLEAGKP